MVTIITSKQSLKFSVFSLIPCSVYDVDSEVAHRHLRGLVAVVIMGIGIGPPLKGSSYTVLCVGLVQYNLF